MLSTIYSWLSFSVFEARKILNYSRRVINKPIRNWLWVKVSLVIWIIFFCFSRIFTHWLSSISLVSRKRNNIYINETWPVKIYSIDTCFLLQIQNQAGKHSINFPGLFFALLISLSPTTSSGELQAWRCKWDQLHEMYVLWTCLKPGFRPASVSWSPGDGLQHDGYRPSPHQTSMQVF